MISPISILQLILDFWKKATVNRYREQHETYLDSNYLSFAGVHITKNLLFFKQASGMGTDYDEQLIGTILFLTPKGLDGIVKIDWNNIQEVHLYNENEAEILLKESHRSLLIFSAKRLRIAFNSNEDLTSFLSEAKKYINALEN